MRSIKKNIYWLITVILLIVSTVHVLILHDSLHFVWGVAWGDAIINTIILSFTIWGIILLIRAYPTTAAIELYALFIALCLSAAAAIAVSKTLKWWEPANESYKEWVEDTLPIRFVIIWVLCSGAAITAALRKNLASLESRFLLQADASILLKEAELFKLRQQLQPHFLYNSLNSISALIIAEPDKAQEMIGKLSDFLRSSVKKEAEDTIPIAEELNYIQSYLAIESIRFGDRLQVHIEKEYVDEATIPPFLLQPILENAIKFGLYGRTGAVSIIIHIELDGPILNITITNPYDADVQPPKGTGFGLDGIQRRLYLLYARTDLLEINKDEEYFTTILKIPQHHVQSNTD